VTSSNETKKEKLSKKELETPTFPHTEGVIWTVVRFKLMMRRAVITPIRKKYHYYFNENLLGYLFVQEEPKKLRQFFEENAVPCLCIYDPLTHEFATMSDDKVIRLEMAMNDPSTVLSIMPHPIEYYAVGHDELVCVNGPIPGAHGYIIRTHRDRKFVFKIDNGITLSTSLMPTLKFLTPEEYASLPKSEKF